MRSWEIRFSFFILTVEQSSWNKVSIPKLLVEIMLFNEIIEFYTISNMNVSLSFLCDSIPQLCAEGRGWRWWGDPAGASRPTPQRGCSGPCRCSPPPTAEKSRGRYPTRGWGAATNEVPKPLPCTLAGKGSAAGVSGDDPGEPAPLPEAWSRITGFIVPLWLGILRSTDRADGELKSQDWAGSGNLCPAWGVGVGARIWLQDSLKEGRREVRACSLPPPLYLSRL